VASIKDLIDKSEYDLALASIKKALVQDEYNIELLTLKAQVSHKLEIYDEVVIIYNTLINLIPNRAENYAGRGLAYHALGEHKQTLTDLTKAIELEPGNSYRYASRAFIKDYLGDFLGALEDYNKAVELDPQDGVSLNNRGLIEEKLGRMHLAQESFASADKLAGIDNQTYNPLIQPAPVLKQKKPRVDFKFIIGIIKDLLNSANERKKFVNFLFKRSGKRNK
jgi:tetratricopeptide (TPR) repeat protein